MNLKRGVMPTSVDVIFQTCHVSVTFSNRSHILDFFFFVSLDLIVSNCTDRIFALQAIGYDYVIYGEK